MINKDTIEKINNITTELEYLKLLKNDYQLRLAAANRELNALVDNLPQDVTVSQDLAFIQRLTGIIYEFNDNLEEYLK